MKKKSVILLICMILVLGNVMSVAAQETRSSKLYINGVLATEEERAAYGQGRGRGRSDQGIQPYWLFTSNTAQGLVIKEDGTAHCGFTIDGYQGEVIKITVRTILEKKQPMNTYAVVTYWDKSTNSFRLVSEDTYKVPSNGVYRVRVQYTVYHTPGAYETIEGYSDTWYFNNY